MPVASEYYRDGVVRKPKLDHARASHAMQFAVMAITQLQSIGKEDPEKSNALNRVINFCETQGQVSNQEEMWQRIQRMLETALQLIEKSYKHPLDISSATKTEILGNLTLLKMYFIEEE